MSDALPDDASPDGPAAPPEQPSATRRHTAPALERILLEPFRVLDHGFVRVVDYMGNDDAIVQAARVSYGKGTKRRSQDAALIRYLLRHRHTTPFEMCEIKLHIKLPIFVARQWIRHRTANVNEYSARYSMMDREYYIPEPVTLAAQSDANRQGREGGLEDAEVRDALSRLDWVSRQAYGVYRNLLNESETGEKIDERRSGVARELARAALPVNYYTQFYWKIDLHNLLHFLSLRADAHAQYEIRAYAELILDEIVRRWVPVTWQAFQDYVHNAASLSAGALGVVRRMLAGEPVTEADSGLGAREWRELMALLHREP